jgi:general secretion pathway protein D
MHKRLFFIAALALPEVVFAQQPAAPPPPAGPAPAGAAAAKPTPTPGTTIAPKKPSCDESRRKGRYNIYFDKVEIEKLVQTVSDVTCKTFILPENIRGKISIIGPENGKVEVDADQFYAAFLAALDANSLAVYGNGKFLKIVDKQRAKQFPIQTILDPTEQYTTNEQMITRMFRIKHVEIETLRGVLQQLVTPSGDTIPFQPDTIIINDLASNMHRLEKLVEQLDSRLASDEMRVLQIQYATAQEMADKITKLFEVKAPRPGQRPGGFVPPPPPGAPPAPGAAPSGAPDGASQGPATLTQLIPDERTNKLIIIASPAAMERAMALIREIDIPISGGEGKINVYYLENANAEDVASTLQTLAQGTANRPKGPVPPPAPGAPRASSAAELFSGEVKVSADKSTNALVIIAAQNDYRSLVRVIEKLDIQRRQVFVEAVIMEVNLDRNSELGINFHGGVPLPSSDVTPLFFGTKYGRQGLPPSLNLANLISLSGFLGGISSTQNINIAGLNIPNFGLVINALQTSSDVNVLSTPHILTTDNEEAEITVGQNVPFQSGFSAGGLGGFGGLGALGGLGGANANLGGLGGLGGLGALGGLGGLGGGVFGQIQRQNVDLKLSIKPQINDSDFVRLVINEQIEEIASSDPVLGPTTSKRSAKTTVVAKDQETVVIGGIMQDRLVESVSKTPLLGDIPLVGNLFRQQTRRKVKTNLLLFLTPYIIRDAGDFRRIFERKLKERQQFVEQFYGATTAYDVAIDFSRKPGPLARMSQLLNKELNRIENGGPGNPGERVIAPSAATPASPNAPTPSAPTPGPQAQPPAGPPPVPVKEPNPEQLKVQPEIQ